MLVMQQGQGQAPGRHRHGMTRVANRPLWGLVVLQSSTDSGRAAHGPMRRVAQASMRMARASAPRRLSLRMALPTACPQLKQVLVETMLQAARLSTRVQRPRRRTAARRRQSSGP